MAETIHYRFLVRGGTAAALASRNEIPLARELVVETDTGKIKLGDAVTPFNDLPYLGGGAGISLAVVVDDGSTAYSVANAHANVYRRLTNAAAKTITVRPQSTEALDTDYEQHFDIDGAGEATFVPGSGVTIKPPAGGTLVVPEGGVVTLKRISTDVFRLLGSTVPAPGAAVSADEVEFDNATSGLSATNVQAAIDELAAVSVNGDLDLITEAIAFTASPTTHSGREKLILAAGDVTFNVAQGYVAGNVFNIHATASIELLGVGVTLTPAALGTNELEAAMTVTVAMTSSSTGRIIGQSVAAP